MTIQARPRARACSTSIHAASGDANSQQAIAAATPMAESPAGASTRRAHLVATPKACPPAGDDARPARQPATSNEHSSGGPPSPRVANDEPAPIQPAPRGDQATGRHPADDAQSDLAAGTNSRLTTPKATTASPPSGGTSTTGRHVRIDNQPWNAAGSDAQAIVVSVPSHPAPAAARDPAAIEQATPRSRSLLDPALAFAADVLDDLERVRIANENRLRQLTRSGEDADGEERGFGLDESHPDVARLAAIVETLRGVEHDAELELARKLRKHPLGPWCKAQKGIGEKQAARLLAAIGDPYLNSAKGTPRTVSALWAYAGLHVLPVGHGSTDTQEPAADRNQLPASHARNDDHARAAGGAQLRADQTARANHQAFVGPDQLPGQTSSAAQITIAGNGGDSDQSSYDNQDAAVGVAPRRRRGELANWSTLAKTRCYLIAASCIKQLDSQCRAVHGRSDTHTSPDGEALRHLDGCGCSPYRVVYDTGRAKYADAAHDVACAQCGPSGKPAQPGSALSAGHQHARAMRLAMKAILRDLWREARRIHLGEPA